MWFIYVLVPEQFLFSQLFHFSQKHNSVRGWGKTEKLGSREALLLHTHRWVMTTQKERLKGSAALFDVTTNQSEMRGRSRERRGKEDLSWFDVTIYQGTGECNGWERNGGSAGSGRERELMCGFVCSSRRLVKWTVILAFNFPSAFSRKNRREERSTWEESRKKENEEIHISLLTNSIITAVAPSSLEL